MGVSVPSGASQNVLQSSESVSLKAFEPNVVLYQYPKSLTLCQWFYSLCLVRLLNGFCCLTLTLFGQRIRNAEVVLVEVQKLHRSVQGVASLVDLVGRRVHGNLRRTRAARRPAPSLQAAPGTGAPVTAEGTPERTLDSSHTAVIKAFEEKCHRKWECRF